MDSIQNEDRKAKSTSFHFVSLDFLFFFSLSLCVCVSGDWMTFIILINAKEDETVWMK